MGEFLRYSWMVWCHAASAARKALREWIIGEAVIVIASFITAIVVASETTSSWPDVVTVFAIPLLALVATIGVAFVGSLVYAPVAIDKEQRQQITRLSPAPGVEITMAPRRDSWVHLEIRNTGQTDVFIALVTDSVSPKPLIPHWSMKWRQGNGEQRLTKGEARLLEVGEAAHGYTYPSEGPQGLTLGYTLVSTTATFPAGFALVGYLSPSAEPLDFDYPPVGDDFRCTLSLHIEVRGVNLGSLTPKWLNLGFDAEGNPLVEVADQPLATPGMPNNEALKMEAVPPDDDVGKALTALRAKSYSLLRGATLRSDELFVALSSKLLITAITEWNIREYYEERTKGQYPLEDQARTASREFASAVLQDWRLLGLIDAEHYDPDPNAGSVRRMGSGPYWRYHLKELGRQLLVLLEVGGS